MVGCSLFRLVEKQIVQEFEGGLNDEELLVLFFKISSVYYFCFFLYQSRMRMHRLVGDRASAINVSEACEEDNLTGLFDITEDCRTRALMLLT